jgi:3-oxoacyl-[acyl-carrier protein] reductase
MGQRHPLKRVGTAEDIAQMTAFLLGEQSSWMTGQVLGVDGGLSKLNLS